MRKLGLLAVLILVLVFPGAATAAWQGSSPWKLGYGFGDQLSFDRYNTGLMWAESDETPGAGWLLESFDGGTGWDAPGALTPGGKNFDVGFDAKGNRVWAYSLSNTIAVTRGSTKGGPDDAPITRYVEVPRVTDLKIAVNPAGDVLIGWTNDRSGEPGVAFWGADDDAPGEPQILDGAWYGCVSNNTPMPFLDAHRSATFVWTCRSDTVGGYIGQSSTEDASVPGGFGPGDRLAIGEVVGGGQAPDGRAALLIAQKRTIPENATGLTTTKVLQYASRSPRMQFHEPIDLAGDAETKLRSVSGRVAVTPSGRVLIGYTTIANTDPEQWCGLMSPTAGASNFMATGVISTFTGKVTLASTELSTRTVWTPPPTIAIGSDGRLALAYSTNQFCGIKPSFQERILLAEDGNNFEEIENPYSGGPNLRDFVFTGKGQLFVIAIHPAWPNLNFSNLYDTDEPLTPLIRPTSTGPTDAGPTAPAGDDSSPRVAGLAGPRSVRVISVRSNANGKLLVIVKTNAKGKLSLIARSGKATVARASGNARGFTKTFQLKLNPRAAKKLAKDGRLMAKLTVSFRPDSGIAPTPATRRVTFKK